MTAGAVTLIAFCMSGDRRELRRGWTTGACAAAASKSACAALLGGEFLDPVTIRLPGGQQPAFALAKPGLAGAVATASIVKDAGDDPDVTHGALITVSLTRGVVGKGLVFQAGEGVGTVTRAGLPVPPGEPAINPMPRKMIARAIADIAGEDRDFEVTISVPGGEEIAKKTLNGRLGVVGGISILGTTGIVIPYSCSSWIHSIHRGIDVARAAGHCHVAGSTGSASEKAIQAMHGLSDIQLLDMGDFVGGTLKYIRSHPVSRVTIAGGVAKITKLGQGLLDLHSSRGVADMTSLADQVVERGGDEALTAAVGSAGSVAEAFFLAHEAGVEIGNIVARNAWKTAAAVLNKPEISLEIVIFDRKGNRRGHFPFTPTGHESLPRKRR